MDGGESVRPAFRQADDRANGRKLAVLQCGGIDLRPEARKCDEHDYRERHVRTGVAPERAGEYDASRRMLVAPGLRCSSSAGGTVASRGQKTRRNYPGYHP